MLDGRSSNESPIVRPKQCRIQAILDFPAFENHVAGAAHHVRVLSGEVIAAEILDLTIVGEKSGVKVFFFAS